MKSMEVGEKSMEVGEKSMEVREKSMEQEKLVRTFKPHISFGSEVSTS